MIGKLLLSDLSDTFKFFIKNTFDLFQKLTPGTLKANFQQQRRPKS